MASNDMEIDPAIAEAMGFSGFGMQTSKKRKHGDEDSFAFVDTKAQAPSTGANATPSTSRSGQSSNTSQQQVHPAAGASPSASSQPAVGPDGKPTLEALRHGVRDAQGDMVYFLPSFIEDPWKGLEPK